MALNEHGTGGGNGGAERDPRLERLYREAAHEAPPAHLDAAILAAGRREVGARPRSLASELRRWHVPVSVAAVVVVSATLVFLVREEEMAGRPTQAPIPAAATPAAEQAAAPQTPLTPGEATSDTAQRRFAAPASQRPELRDDVTLSAALGKREDRSRAEPGPPPPSGAAAVSKPESAAKPLPQPFRAATPGLAEERAAPASADTVVAGRLESAPAVASEPDRPAPDARRAMSAAPELTVRAAKQVLPPVWKGFEKEPPEKWLARIEELRREGRSAEAEDMLSEFKRRFPEHPQAAKPR